ncbi:Vms1/Ankzf1 family peptidyl-tRNA hydrolase [Methanolobus sp. ZRKC3]|uniref:Vms1/Ankzf1 family peptidyl-tRNA hydrolase n=1 Tax=Methanolobus sp. ZRKC3 TaxID=3125786 RepID=UPI0032487C0D
MAKKEKVVENVNYLFNKYTGKEKLEGQIDHLQSHIVELEIDNKTLRTKFEKSAANEKKAVAAKQDAEEALNAAGFRISTLEHEIEKNKENSFDHLSFSHVDMLSIRRMQDYVSTLSSLRSPEETLLTLYVCNGSSVSGIFGNDPVEKYIDPDTLHLLEKIDSQNGFVLFHDRDSLVNEVIIPPLPVETSKWLQGTAFNTEQLLGLLSKELSICILLAHAGESFVAYSLDSRHLDSYELIRSNVKSKHGKGGFSQRRFERLRDEEIVHHADKVRESLGELINNLEFDFDYLVIGGDQNLANLIIKDIDVDIPLLFSPVDIRVEKHASEDVLRQVFLSRRYKL